MLPHEKIIKTTAKKILEPEKLFQAGNSRCYLDDNGYFMIQVEFQPVTYMKGSGLNVGVAFLWESTKALNDTLAHSYGGAVGASFVKYQNDDSFQADMEVLAKTALEKVEEYRKFSDMDYAKKCLQAKIADTPQGQFWEWYDLAMLCFLNGDYEEGKAAFARYLEILRNSFYQGGVYIEWKEEFYNYCIENIECNLTSKEAAHQMVVDMINRRRKFFSAKPSYKKIGVWDYK